MGKGQAPVLITEYRWARFALPILQLKPNGIGLSCSNSGNPTQSPLILGFADSTQPINGPILSFEINQT